jgi:two-component system, NarL family, sensor kinase
MLPKKIALFIKLAWLQLLVLQPGFLLGRNHDTLLVGEDFKDADIGKYIRYLQDGSDTMRLEHFLESSSPTLATLRANTKDEVVLGYTQSQHFLQCRLMNTSADTQRLYLSIAYPNLDHFLLYVRVNEHDRDSIRFLAEMGDNFRGGNKILPHRNYVIPIILSPNIPTDFIFQIKKQWEPVNFPLFLSNEFNFVRRSNNDNLFLGMYFGIHFTFALLIITLYLFTRNLFFLLYFFLNVLSILNMLSDTGIGLQHIWAGLPALQKILPYLITFGSIIIHISFIRQFFSTALHFRRYNTFLLGLLGMAAFTLILLITFAFLFPGSNLPFQIGYNVINSLYLGYGLVIASLCGVAYYQIKRKEILWVLMVISIQYMNWVLDILIRGNAFPSILKDISIYQLNFFPGHIATPHIVIIIITLEIIVVSFILSVNFYGFIKDNTSGQYKLMLLQRKNINAYIEGQEYERERLANRIDLSIKEDVAMLQEQTQGYLLNLKDPIARAKMNHIINDLHGIENDIGQITSNFVPSDYVRKSFYEAIRSIYQPLQASGIHVKYDLIVPAPRVNDFSKINICRILQEIAGNINKHAFAKEVHIQLSYDQFLRLTISDNGRGFDVNSKKGGIGLLNIESRVKGMNGSLKVTSEPGKGTKFQISIPMRELLG